MELLMVVEKQRRVLRWQSLTLDLDERSLRVGTSEVAASRAEFGLLHMLICNRNLPMSKDSIMATLFGVGHGRDLRLVDMLVARLRQALSVFGLAALISTIGGRGYAVLDDHGDAAPATGSSGHGRLMATLAC